MTKHEGGCVVMAVVTKKGTEYWCDTCNEDIKGEVNE